MSVLFLFLAKKQMSIGVVGETCIVFSTGKETMLQSKQYIPPQSCCLVLLSKLCVVYFS